MDGVPSVGGTRGIFEIFVPGAFLFLNIVGAAYVWMEAHGLDDSSISSSPDLIKDVAEKPVPALAVLVCFGYLLGIVLRLLRTSFPDTLSGYFGLFLWRSERSVVRLLQSALHTSSRKRRGGNGSPKESTVANNNETDEETDSEWKEEFPYPMYLGRLASKMLPPEDAGEFYENFWSKHATSGNKSFFNYCKTIVGSLDPTSTAEIYAAEALSRYVASMFYALVISFLLGSAALPCVVKGGLTNLEFPLSILLCTYLLAIGVILRNLKRLRAKEVEAVFVATMLNYYSGRWPKAKKTWLRNLFE